MTLGLLLAACIDDIYRSRFLNKEKIRMNARYISDLPAFSETNKAVVQNTSVLVVE